MAFFKFFFYQAITFFPAKRSSGYSVSIKAASSIANRPLSQSGSSSHRGEREEYFPSLEVPHWAKVFIFLFSYFL